jgi:hypothetical protein
VAAAVHSVAATFLVRAIGKSQRIGGFYQLSSQNSCIDVQFVIIFSYITKRV